MKKKDKQNTAEIVLVTAQGADSPGITCSLTKIIADAQGSQLLDIEQTVVHGKLLLSLLLEFQSRASHNPVLKDLLFAAKRLNVTLSFETFDNNWLHKQTQRHQYAITCLGEEIGASPLCRIAQALAHRKVNIDRIGKLTRSNMSCIELLISAEQPLDHRQLSRDLLPLASELEIDLAIQPADMTRRAKRLIVLDMDSTLIKTEVIDELGKLAGVGKQMASITASTMKGDRGFTKSLKARVKLLRGLPVSSFNKVYRKIKLTEGAELLIKVLKHLGFKTALISGGFTHFTNKLQHRLKLDYAFANTLEVKNGLLTGRICGDVVDSKRKAMLLDIIAQSEGISLDQVIAVGDGANDLPMLTRAGLGIAFHAHERVRRRTTHGLSKRHGLDTVLYLLGIPEREVKGMSLNN